MVYENVCVNCNPGAGKKGELEQVKNDTPTLYVGEMSRTVYERSKEHWAGWRTKSSNNHILKHHQVHHGGQGEPAFIMKVVGYYRTALARQVAEGVRIRRRGGAVRSNSKLQRRV